LGLAGEKYQMNRRILVVDDDPELACLLALWLGSRGFQVHTACCGCDGLRVAYDFHPDLVILDVMMPDMDGYQTCQRLRERSDIPVLMLTAKTAQEDVIQGFQAGADDYVKKPFDFQELEARLHVLLKRSGSVVTCPVYDDGNLRIDLQSGHVYRDGVPVQLSPTEYRLLWALVARQGCVISQEDLLKEVWGESYGDALASLSLYIQYLREKLEDEPGEPEYIRTEWGSGYWFAEKTQIIQEVN
jgi:two-component system KDP operon response regulator KdpE